MINWARPIVAMATFALISVPVAHSESVTTFLEMCNSRWPHKIGYCDGYIVGVLEVYRNLMEHGIMKRLYCLPPEEVKQWDITEPLKAWLEEHPEKKDVVASGAILGIVMDRYPCN